MPSTITRADLFPRQFTFSELLSIVEVTHKQVDVWSTRGLIDIERPGSGYGRKYEFRNLLEAAVVAELLRICRSLDAAEDTTRKMRRCFAQQKLTPEQLYLGNPENGDPYQFLIIFTEGVLIDSDRRRRDLKMVHVELLTPDLWALRQVSLSGPVSMHIFNISAVAHELVERALKVLT
jgi:MerR HTH family regulatory protein